MTTIPRGTGDDRMTSSAADEKPFLVIEMPDDTLGSIATVLRAMLDLGITSASIQYALSRVDGTA